MNATLDHAAGVEAGRNAPTVRVWDPLVRLFHWSLAACILGAFLVEEGDTAHQWLGYTALLLAFIGVHVAAALVESAHYGENLVAAMVHGRKRALDSDGGLPPG